MITLTQFEKAIAEQKPLYYIDTELEIIEFSPRLYEVAAGEYHTDKQRTITYTVASSDNWYYHAERCFETMDEAKFNLKTMLEEKMRRL